MDVSRRDGFRVWENDYLTDPFELMHLFVLTESELKRVPRDRHMVSQQVHFQLDSTRSRGAASSSLRTRHWRPRPHCTRWWERRTPYCSTISFT